MDKALIVLFGLAASIATALFISFLLAWPIYMLWNGCLVDAVSGVKEVTWLQAWGITIICNFLFKTSVSKS
jgi:hypothetical protein